LEPESSERLRLLTPDGSHEPRDFRPESPPHQLLDHFLSGGLRQSHKLPNAVRVTLGIVT